MSDISVADASEIVLIAELLKRKTDNGTVLFRENSITLEDNTVQLLGLVANVQMTLSPPEPIPGSQTPPIKKPSSEEE